MVAAETIFSTPLAQTALTFLLVFTLVFAILQKSKILGEGKKQIDALVALAIGLIVTSFAYALDVIQRLVPFLAVALVILLVFMLLLAFVYPKDFAAPTWLKITLGIIIGIAVIIAVLIITGGLDYISYLFKTTNPEFIINGILIIIVVGAVLFALFSGGKGGSSGEKK